MMGVEESRAEVEPRTPSTSNAQEPFWNRRVTHILLDACVLVAVALVCCSNTVQPGDAGEFSTVLLGGGVPHPSGYPWIRMLGPFARALEGLGVTPAQAAAIPGAVAGALGFTVLARVAAVQRAPVLSRLAVYGVAVSPLAVRHLYDAEVWGLHALFCAVSLWVATRKTAPVLLGLTLGIAVSNHLTAILMLPLFVGAAWPETSTLRNVYKNGAQGFLGSLLGLSSFVTLRWGTSGAWSWGDTETLTGLWHHVTRGDFGSLQLSIQSGPTPDLWPRLARASANYLDTLTVGLLAAPAVGLLGWCGLSIWWGRHAPLRPALRRGWAAAMLLAGVGFPLAQNIDPASPFGRWICERFDLLPMILAVPPLSWLLVRCSGHETVIRLQSILSVALGLALTLQFARAWPERPAGLTGTQRYALDLIHAPGDTPALVFGTDDHRTFPNLFVSEILHPDTRVVYIDAALLYHPWYRARIEARWPGLPIRDKPLATIGAIWATPALRDTPIYLSNVFSAPARTLPLVPEGLLLRVLPPHVPPEFSAPDAVVQRHLEAAQRMKGTREDFSGAADPALDPFGADLWSRYTLAPRELIKNMAGLGRQDLVRRLLDDAAARGITPAELQVTP